MIDMDKELVFETTLKELPVTIDSKSYVLRELDGILKGKYLNTMGSRIELGPTGQIKRFKDYSGLETTLLELCLYDDENNLVKTTVMREWPSTLLTRLFEAAQELSALDEESKKKLEDEAKNS
jgi:hypothetical protein